MQDMPYLPYGEGAGWKKRFEITIPILLLILVFLVLAWKLNWLCGIPVIGEFMCGGAVINVLVLGDDHDITLALDGLKAEMPLNYEIFDETEIAELRDAAYLNNYNLIILTESAGSKKTDLPSIFRGYLAQYLSNNGKMIMFGVAGSTDPDEPAADGWIQSGMSSYVPARCTTGLCDEVESKDSYAYARVSLKINDINHPILMEFGTAATFTTGATVEYTMVNVPTASKLATIEVDMGGGAHYALVEMSHGLSGKTMYFAYHPSRTPTIFKNTINYIMGR